MALNLSEKDLEELRADLKKAEPYDDDDPIMNTFDGEMPDIDRWMATTARNLLEEYEREQREMREKQNNG